MFVYKIFWQFFFLFFISAVFAAADEVKNFDVSFDDFTVIKEEEKPVQVQKKEEVLPDTKSKTKNNLDEFFDKTLKIFEDLKKKGEKTLEGLTLTSTPQSVPLVKEDPAKSFPDPFFYDAVYNSKKLFITYAFIYEDKTNRDNSHIPKLQNYDIYKELFMLAKSYKEQEKFLNLFHTVKTLPDFNINKTDKYGNTLLLTALRNGNFNIFYFLLQSDANPNICNNKEVCPIHLALNARNITVLQALINKNVDIMVKDKNDLTPLEFAMYENNIPMFELLLKRYLKYQKNQEERIKMIEFAKELEEPEEFVTKMEESFKIK